MAKVSVIVPVYNPGEKLAACTNSLLSQTIPPDELELIFVDDGSTDDSPARLDALAAEHAHVRVEHTPNSGWPGRPRNRGLELATGDYVYFVDNDDWLDPEALERLREMAILDDADIVIGKVVGHGKSSARLLFRENVHGIRFDEKPSLLLKLLTPHKLFRRDFVEENGLRFPEGKRRLEDHLFVVAAYLRADRISVLADHPCYHWVFHDAAENASHQPIGEDYFDAIRDVLDLVEREIEPGELRDRVTQHWYDTKMLKRVGGAGFAARDPERRQQLHAMVRRLALERWDDGVHDRMPLLGRVRSRLLRSGSEESLIALAGHEGAYEARLEVRRVHAPGSHLTIALTARLEGDSPLLDFVREGDRIVWDAPEALRAELRDEDRDVTAQLRKGSVHMFLSRVEDDLQYVLPVTSKVRLDDDVEPGRVVPVLTATTTIAPTVAAGGGPLPPGQWELYATPGYAGLAATTRVARSGGPLVVTSVPPGRIVVGEQAPPPPAFKLRVRARAPWIARAVRRTRAALGAARRG